MVEAVTFDFWNTVMWEEPGSLKRERLAVWSEAWATDGRPLDGRELEGAHDAAHCAYEEAWRAGRQFRVPDAAGLIAERLGSPGLHDTLAEGFSEAGRRAVVQPSPGIQVCLSALRAAGVRLGIICDIGLTPSPVVRELLDRHGLLELFDDTTFSDEVDHYKPARAIFEHALRALGEVPPDRAAHVGDRRRTDVAGALAMGMTAIRYNGVYEDEAVRTPEAHLVVEDLGQIPALIGLEAATA